MGAATLFLASSTILLSPPSADTRNRPTQASNGAAFLLYQSLYHFIMILRKQASKTMKKIALGGKRGKGKFAIVDDDVASLPELATLKWHVATNGYVIRYKYTGKKDGRSNYTPLLLHRFIMDASKGTEVDHASGNKLDNRRANLRFCTRQQNIRNRKVSNKTGYKGIYWRKQSQAYVARLTVDGKAIHAGTSSNPELAALMYDVGAIQLFGDFAHLNIIGRS